MSVKFPSSIKVIVYPTKIILYHETGIIVVFINICHEIAWLSVTFFTGLGVYKTSD